MKHKITHGAWHCFCGYLDRLKFRQIICPCCKTECTIAQTTTAARYGEMAKNLAMDYHKVPKQAIRLTAHHFWVLSQVA
jgi:hypothetical protein